MVNNFKGKNKQYLQNFLQLYGCRHRVALVFDYGIGTLLTVDLIRQMEELHT